MPVIAVAGSPANSVYYALGYLVYCMLSVHVAVGVVLIQVSRCKEISCEQVGLLSSLEHAIECLS